jgi:hypothetical protein
VATSSTYSYGGLAWHKDGQPHFTVAHSDYFGGNVGQPERRAVNGTPSSPSGLVPLDTLDLDSDTRAFVDRLRSIDFDALEQQMEARHANILDEAVSDATWSRASRRSASTNLEKRGAKTLRGCTDSDLRGGATERECTCINAGTSITGVFVVECSGLGSQSPLWTLQAFYDALGALRANIVNLNLDGWPDDISTVAPSSNKGGILFTPALNHIRPSSDSAECCEALLKNMVQSYGFANNMCHCEKKYPRNDWHMLLSDAVLLGVGA